ncbi:RGS domain-containing protein [Plasmodiophora brassicae]
MVVQPELFALVQKQPFWGQASPAKFLESIGVYKMGVSMVAVSILSSRMRIVPDAFGINRALRQIGACSLVGVTIYAFIAGPITNATGGVVSVNSVVAMATSAVMLTL